MRRRKFLKRTAIVVAGAAPARAWAGIELEKAAQSNSPARMDTRLADEWLARWERHILAESRTRYCDREMGEEIGWLVSPFLNGFHFGHEILPEESRWLDLLCDWARSWIERGVKEPDGFVGWPKAGTGGLVEDQFLSDSLLGEAMALRPLVLAAGRIQKDDALRKRYGDQAATWIRLAEQCFEKWSSRGCWRETAYGGVWVVPAFGMDPKTGQWTDGYSFRHEKGFTNPANKQNHIARWLLALHDATGKPVYRDRAEKWWRVMKSRLREQADGKYLVWNYWDPAGPWDFKPDGTTRHWVGVHPNGGYYAIDVEGMLTAFEHDLVFSRRDVDTLIATNRDFMWDHHVMPARFQRLDGGAPDSRWKDTPGVLWTPLVFYDNTLMEIFLANHDPASWGGLSLTPWFLARRSGREA